MKNIHYVSGCLDIPIVNDTKQKFAWLSGKDSTCQCRRCELDPWVRESPGGGNSNPVQYSCQENPMDKRANQATVHRISKSQA